MVDLKTNLENMHSDLHSAVAKVHDLPTYTAGQDTSTKSQLHVPAYLDVKFEDASRAAHPELHAITNFPLTRSINAFHYHFGKCNLDAESENISIDRATNLAQYLDLMKSIWILQKIEKGYEYHTFFRDRLLKLYMEELYVVKLTFNSVQNMSLIFKEMLARVRSRKSNKFR